MFSLIQRAIKIKYSCSNFLAVLFVLTIGFTSVLYSQTPNNATIKFISGEAKLSKGGSAHESGKVNDVIPAGSQVSTGKDSRVEIVFPDGTLARLGSDTVLSIDTRTGSFTLERGTLLLQVPKGAGSINVTTGNVSYELGSATVLLEHSPGGYAKFIVVEGAAKASINSRFGERMPVDAGKMLILPPGSNSLPDPVDVNLRRLVQTSTLIHIKGDTRTAGGVSPFNSDKIDYAVLEQQRTISAGALIDTNLVMLSGNSLVIASDNLLKTLEDRAQENWIVTRTSEPLVVNQGSPFILDATNTINASGTITKNGSQAGTGQIYENYQGDIDHGGFANYVFGRYQNAFESGSIHFNDRFASASLSTFLFNDLAVQGNFGISRPPGTPDQLALVSNNAINVSQPFQINTALNSLNLIASNGAVNINKTITASIAPKSSPELAMETQAAGQYHGVDNWQSHDPLPAGTVIANATSYDYATFKNKNVASSEYFAPDATREAAKVGGVVDARTYNESVQVGPSRDMSKNPPLTAFTYSAYVARYKVMRPLPIAYSKVENNPQFGNGLTSGVATDQYRALFNRNDLVRLGYLQVINYDANDPATLEARITPFTDYAATYISSDDLQTKVVQKYDTEMATRTPAKQQEAADLRNEAIDVQNMTTNRTASGGLTADSKTTRSFQELFVYARGTGSNINVASGQSVSGFGKVIMAAENGININGSVEGAENFSGIAGSGSITVADGGLVEVFTDNRASGGGTIDFSAPNKVEIAGRVQASATPQNGYNVYQKAGSIVLKSQNTDPDAVAINVTDTGQILALINSASYTKSDAGRAKVQLTSAGGKIGIDGLKDGGENYGKNIVADYGDLNIVNNGMKGIIDILSGAGLQADIIKIGALGTQGVLNIYAGSRMDANTQIKLYGGELSGGAIIFGGTGTVYLTSPAILMSADKVQVNTGVNVNTGVIAADVYANKRYWTPAQGGDAGSPQLGTWSKTPNNAGPPKSAGSF
jgi:hypothetical protein